MTVTIQDVTIGEDGCINIVKATDVNFAMTLKDGNGDAIDITGYTIFFTVKEKSTDSDADALITKDVSTHTSPTTGVTTVALTNTQTDIDSGSYRYDFKMKDTTDKLTTIIRNRKFVVSENITDRSS